MFLRGGKHAVDLHPDLFQVGCGEETTISQSLIKNGLRHRAWVMKMQGKSVPCPPLYPYPFFSFVFYQLNLVRMRNTGSHSWRLGGKGTKVPRGPGVTSPTISSLWPNRALPSNILLCDWRPRRWWEVQRPVSLSALTLFHCFHYFLWASGNHTWHSLTLWQWEIWEGTQLPLLEMFWPFHFKFLRSNIAKEIIFQWQKPTREEK